MIKIDNFFYKIYYFILPKIIPCSIHPNTITLLRSLLILPIINNYANNKSVYMFLFYHILNNQLDMMDGTQARLCNKESFLGNVLDHFFDGYLQVLILIVVLIKIFKIKKIIKLKNEKYKISRKYLISLCIFIYIICFYIGWIYLKLQNQPNHNKLHLFYLNNLTFSSTILYLAIKLYCNKFTKTIKEIDSNK